MSDRSEFCEACKHTHHVAVPPYCTLEREKVTGQLSALRAEIAALKAQLSDKAHAHCAYCGCVTHKRLKDQVATQAAELDDMNLSVSVFEEEFNDDSWDVDKVERAQEFLDRWNKARGADQ